MRYGAERLRDIEGVRIIGNAAEKGGVLSFVMDVAHAHDIGTILDAEGIAVRTGHHCAQPVMARYNIAATARASLAIYNTTDDIDALVKAIDRVIEVFWLMASDLGDLYQEILLEHKPATTELPYRGRRNASRRRLQPALR